MKRKIIISISACITLCGGILLNTSLDSSISNDISLKNISLMAQADAETGGSGSVGSGSIKVRAVHTQTGTGSSGCNYQIRHCIGEGNVNC